MLRQILALVFPCILLAAGCTKPTITATPDVAKVRVVAVLPFSDAPGAEGGYSGRTVASLVTQQLMSLPNVQLVEREKIKAVLDEIDFKIAMTNDDAKVVNVGKLVGADTVVVGSVTQYNTSSGPVLDVYNVGVSFRMVRVNTAKLCFSGSCTQIGMSYEEAGRKSVSLIVDELAKRLPNPSQKPSTLTGTSP